MTTDLRFVRRLDTSHPVDLRFGQEPAIAPSSTLNLVSTIEEPRGSIRLAVVIPIVLQSPPLQEPIGQIRFAYDNAVYRGPQGSIRSTWQQTIKHSHITESRHDTSSSLHNTISSLNSMPEYVGKSTSFKYDYGISTKSESASIWIQADCLKRSIEDNFGNLSTRIRPTNYSNWNDASPVKQDIANDWQERIHLPRPQWQTLWKESLSLRSKLLSVFGKGSPLYLSGKERWQESRKPIPGRHLPPTIPTPPSDRCYIPPGGLHVDLLFKDLLDGSTDLIFTCMRQIVPTITKIIPIRSTYIVINDLNLTRVDGNHDLPVNNLSLNIDMSSWTWSFSASMHASALPLLEPDSAGNPTVLRATINGANYLLIAETVKRDRTFGRSNISVSGRGLSATLDAPYSPVRSFNNAQDRTAQQLMQDALTINGVALDWSIDWRIDDWLVPAGTFSHSGSYINALTTIANAAGAFLQPDPVNQVIRVRHKVPIKPWEIDLATPEIELPSAVVTRESISWGKKADYNAVYVSGTSASGILGLVKKTGTAGDSLAPMVSDALITSAVAARQRGLTVLADTGKMATYSLSLPVLTETGIIEPGTSVRYKDDKDIIGIVQGVSVSGESDKRSVRQTIEVLTYV